jgi:hypothetical protein
MRRISGVLVGLSLVVPRVVQAADSVATRGAALVLKVETFETARQKVSELTLSSGGEVREAHSHVVEKGRRHGTVQLSVPAQKLEPLLTQLRGLGIPSGERTTTLERWSESEELARRAERSKGHQVRLNGLLGSGRRLRGSDVLYVEERLVRAENDEDMLRLQREKLLRATTLSKVTVVLFEPPALPKPNVTHPRRDLVLSWIPTVLTWAFWLIVAGATGWVVRWWRRQQQA